MIKFLAHHENGRAIVGLGISAENVRKLKEGLPIHVALEEMNLPWEGEILIFYGETEQDMVNELKPALKDVPVKTFTEKQ